MCSNIRQANQRLVHWSSWQRKGILLGEPLLHGQFLQNTESESIFQVPGFESFVIETFAMNCCLYSVLDKSFEFRDANTVSSLLRSENFLCKYE